MDMDLTELEIRVLGSLMEKEITTPEQYPLSLNALMLACNQKSNRDPVLNLDESETIRILDSLSKRYLVAEQTGFGSRVVKYKHKFCNAILSELQFSPQQLAVICVLFLRGPQTPGELRTRTARLCKFSDVEEVEQVLDGMIAWKPGPLVAKLAREPGKRESRFAHLFSGPVKAAAKNSEASPASMSSGVEGRLASLEQQVERLQAEIDRLKQTLLP
jgi:hypothetical protein